MAHGIYALHSTAPKSHELKHKMKSFTSHESRMKYERSNQIMTLLLFTLHTAYKMKNGSRMLPISFSFRNTYFFPYGIPLSLSISFRYLCIIYLNTELLLTGCYCMLCMLDGRHCWFDFCYLLQFPFSFGLFSSSKWYNGTKPKNPKTK